MYSSAKRRLVRSLSYLLAVEAMLFFLIHTASAVSSPLHSADKLRVEYIFYFTKYVEWPESWLDSESQAIHICLDSDEEFKRLMQTSYAGRLSKGHPLQVLEYQDGPELCHLTYLQGRSENEIPNTSTILISDSGAKQTNDSAIVLTERGGKIKFEVYLENLEATGIRLSSEFLKLVKVRRR